MPHLTTPHVMKCALLYSHFSEEVNCENTFYLEDPTDNMFSDPSGLALQIFNAAVTDLIPELSSWVVLKGVSLEDVRSIPYGGADFPQAATQGTAAATPKSLPTCTAYAIKRLTGTLGRSYRGRWYWPFWEGSDLADADEVLLTKANSIVAALTSFQAGVEGGTYPCSMGIVTQQTGGVVRANGVFYPITSWAYSDLFIDNQRRRLLGRGA